MLFQVKGVSYSQMYFQLKYFPKSQKKMQFSTYHSALGIWFSFPFLSSHLLPSNTLADRSFPTCCPARLSATDMICLVHRTNYTAHWVSAARNFREHAFCIFLHIFHRQMKLTLRKERSDNHILMFSTFLSLKWGISYFLAFLAEVIWLKSFANKNL